MSHGTTAVVFTGASVLALAVLAHAVREARRAEDVDSATVLAFATGLLLVAPDLLVALTGSLRRAPDVFGDIVAINPGWYGRVNQLALLALAGIAALLLTPRVTSRRTPVHASGLLALLLWTLANVSSGLHGGGLLSARAGVLLLLLLAATVLPRGRGACLGAGVFVVVFAAAGGILSSFRYDVAFIVPCEGACSGLGFTGVLPNENLTGIVLAAGLPLVYLGFRGPARIWLSLYLLGAAVATGSRTATFASAITLAALLVVRPRLDQPGASTARLAVAWCVLAGSIAGSLFVVLHHWSSTSLTTRPALWAVAWRHIGRSPWFGHGPTSWAGLYRSSEIPFAAQRTSHNQWTDVLYVSGGVGAAVFACVILAAIWSSGRARTGVLLALASIFLVGTTEGALSIGTADLLSFFLVTLVLTGEAPAKRLVPVRIPAGRARLAPAGAPFY